MEQRFTQNHKITVNRSDDGSPQIAGYAAVFYREEEPGTEFRLADDYVERIEQGAFDSALEESHDARALFNHDKNFVLGRVGAGTVRLSVDEIGLRYTIDVPDTQLGRDVVTSIERGDITGSSFAFSVRNDGANVERQKEAKTWVRTLNDLDLFDVGPVTYPAYTATTTGLRSEEAMQELAATLEREGLELEAVSVRARMIELGLI